MSICVAFLYRVNPDMVRNLFTHLLFSLSGDVKLNLTRTHNVSNSFPVCYLNLNRVPEKLQKSASLRSFLYSSQRLNGLSIRMIT